MDQARETALRTRVELGILGPLSARIDGGELNLGGRRQRAVVDAFYQAGIEARLTSFARYLDPDFKVTAPNYLPWGGTHSGAAFFRDEILPNLPDVFDFVRFSYDSVIA